MTAATLSPDDMARLVDDLRLIGHPARLRLLASLGRGERGVGSLVEETGFGAVLVSQQLAFLRKAGMVRTRREARQVFYSLADARLGQTITALSRIIGTRSGGEPRPAPMAAPPRGVSAAMFARIVPRA